MTEPRTLTRLLLGFLALYLAWQAQSRLSGPNSSDGLILYGIAIALFVVAFARVRAAQLARGQLTESLPQLLELPPWRLLLLVLAFASALVSLGLFTNPSNLAWLLHLASVALFLAALLPFDAWRSRALVIWQWFPFLVVLALAVFARLWQIDQFPFGTWYDEADNGNYAVQMLQDPTYRPVYAETTNLPAHFIYLIALSFKLFGVSTISMRFVTAAFGIVTVVFAYLLFRRWFDELIAFAAGVMFAVLRYDLTFSRIALHGVTTPAFEVAVLYFFDRALEHKRPIDFALTGVLLGFGLAFYVPFRLFPFALLIFVGGLFIALLRRHDLRDWIRPSHWIVPLAIVVCGTLLAIAPVAQFAVQHRDVFFARTSQVSLFDKRDEPDLLKALWSNTQKHLLMFNVLGDRNGRHNLPNEPMLDPIMGALGALGFCYALWRWRNPPNALMLLVFSIMNLGGILSVDFEAPQALRSIGVMPALVYFAALPLAALSSEWARVLRQPTANLRSPLSSLQYPLIAILLLAISLSNFDTFFNKQKNSPDVWAAHSAAETIVANEMNRLAPSYDLIISSLYASHPTVRFIAPNVSNYQQWTVNDHLPLARATTDARGVALLLDPLLQATYDAARRYYPSAAYREFKPPSSGTVAVYEAQLSSNDLRAVQGLVARYFKGDSFEGAPVKEEVVAQVHLDWTQAQPVSGAFAVELQGTLVVAQYGAYTFSVRGAPTSTLLIDENPVGSAPLQLAQGNHALRLRALGGAAKLELSWQGPGAPQMQLVPSSALFRPPVTNSGLLGAYYSSPNWSGAPAFTRVDPELSLYFHNIPLPRPYSVEWKGKVYAPTAGPYRFATESIDDSQALINSQIVVNNAGRAATIEGVIQLPQGWNDIVVRFADKTSHTHIYLYWTPPGGPREIVPSFYLSPPMGRYPAAEEIAARPKPLPAAESSNGAISTPPVTQVTPPSAAPFTLNHIMTIGTQGSGPAQFNDPHAIAVGVDGRVYVADTGNRRMQILDENGAFIAAIEGGEQPFVEPFGVVVASTGEVIALDSEEGWLYRFDADGHALGRMGGPSAQFFHPRALSIDAQDNLYVADTGGSRVVKLSLSGQRLQVFGAKGTGKGQFIEPSDAAMDAAGTLFATDVPNKRIEAFSADGRFLFDFPIPFAGAFNGPHIAFAPDQTLLVTAPEPHKLQRYARDGKLIGEWGGAGTAPGQFRLPTGIAVSGNVVWIADTGNHRVQKWEIQ